jgi:hypothetical protein
MRTPPILTKTRRRSPQRDQSSLVVSTGSLQAEKGVNWTTRPGQGALADPNNRLRLGVAHCSELLVDLPDYRLQSWNLPGRTGWIFRHNSGDQASLRRSSISSRPCRGTTASAIVGLGLPTGTHRISGIGYHPYIQFPWSQAIAEGWSANGMVSTFWFTDQPAGNATVETNFNIDQHRPAFRRLRRIYRRFPNARHAE